MGAIDEDPRLVALKNLPLVWHPPLVQQIDLTADGVHIVTGPRQVGKSTAIRLLIRRLLLEARVPPRNLLLFDCDIVEGSRELAEIVMHFLERVAGSGRKYIFLDEVSAVEKWPMGIKWLVDHGKGSECSYALTGSSSIKLKKSGEFMPARRGVGRDFELHPLTFGQYTELRGFPPPAFGIRDLTPARVEEIHSRLLLDVPEVEALFQDYRLHGGFLKPINEWHQKGIISPDTVDVYLSWIRGEIVRDKRREQVARTVLDRVAVSLGSGLSYQTLAEQMDVGSHNTARSYLDFFIDSFILHEVPFVEISQRRIAWRKNRKYYFSDPFLCWISMLWAGGGDNVQEVVSTIERDASRMGPVVENIVEAHLRRNGFSPCYGAARGREIDFAMPEDDIGIEVKYQTRVVPSDASALVGFEHAIVVSRDQVSAFERSAVVPAFLFCLARGEGGT